MDSPGINDLPPWFAEQRRLEAENARLRATLQSVNKAIWKYRSHQVSHQESYDLFRHACDLIENAIRDQ